MASDRPDPAAGRTHLAAPGAWPMLATGFAARVGGGRVMRRGVGRSFTRTLLLRTALLGLALAGLAWAISVPDLGATRVVAGLMCLLAGWAVWAHVRRTNLELARFVEALDNGDLSQGFAGSGGDGGFGELGAVLDGTMRRLREERGRLSEDARFSFALVEEAPTPLLTVDGAGRVRLVNKAARRLFGDRDGVERAAFAACGEAFVAALDPAREPQRRALVPLVVGGMPQRAMLSMTAVSRPGLALRLVAVEPIQRELAAAEVAAQTDLVRVLTHEIMNSLTPVTSLARTAATLMARVNDAAGADVADARQAVATLARRADALLHFVESYRQFARVPDVRRRRFAAEPWARELERLFGAAAHGRGVRLTVAATEPDLTLDADPDLLAQALINLMKNAAEAAAERGAAPEVALILGPGAAIAVEDNGAGLAPGLSGDIFLPFFTTKADGTGVGLSVARQIVVAHGGTIRAENRAEGGARLRIVL